MTEIITTLAPTALPILGMWIGGFMVGYGTAALRKQPPLSGLADHIRRTTGKN